VLRERAPIDDEFDLRLQVDANGVQGRPAGITAWIDHYHDRLRQARAEFSRVHAGATSNDIAELARFMHPPLTAAQLEKVVAFERERDRQ
jgi:hypothetical protein